MNRLEQTVGIFTTDEQIVVRSWDAWLANVTGMTANVVRGSRLFELFPEIALQEIDALFQTVLTQGTVKQLDSLTYPYLIPCAPIIQSKKYKLMQQRVTITPLREQDKIVGTIITIEDITVQRERERDIDELREQLKSASETKRMQAVQHLDKTTEDMLFEALGDDSWRVRQGVIEKLKHRSEPEAILTLVRKIQYEHQDMTILNSALQALTRIQGGDVVTPLTNLLKVPDADLRGYVTLALGEQQDRRAIPALIDALNDKNANVRYNAIEALGKLKATEAINILMDIAESGDFFLAFPALDSLKRIGDPSVTPRIIPLMQDSMLVEPAIDVLGQLGDETIIAPLAKILDVEEGLTTHVVQAIGALYDRYEELYVEGERIGDQVRQAITPIGIQHLLATLPKTSNDALRAYALVLGWFEGQAVEHALIALIKEPTVRKEVIGAIVRYGPRVTETLLQQLAEGEIETRCATVHALGRIGDKGVVPTLIHILETEEDETLLCTTADALTKIGESDVYDPLERLLRHPAKEVREVAVAALNALNPPTLTTTIKTLLQDPDPLIRECAVKIAGYIGADYTDALLASCQDPDENVRHAAIEVLPYLEDSRVSSVLMNAVTGDTPRIKAVAIQAIGNSDEFNGELVEVLQKALHDDDIWVRYFAARSLGQRKITQAIEALIHLAHVDTATQVRIAAIGALRQMESPQTIPTLLVLKNAENLDIAKASLIALGRIDDPNALEPLVATLDDPNLEKRITAVQALENYPRPEAVLALCEAVNAEQDIQIIKEIIRVLASMKTPDAITALLTLSVDPRQRETCINTLSHLDERYIDIIAKGLTHEHINVRLATVEIFTRMQHPLATQKIITVLEDEVASLRLVAINALGRLGVSGMKQKFLEIAERDGNIAVQRAAQKFITSN